MINHSLPTRIRLELLRRIKYSLFMISGPMRVARLGRLLRDAPDFVIVVVAFNDYDLIEVQLDLLTISSQHKFLCLVADNSSDYSASPFIKKVAEDRGAAYVRLPRNLYSNSRGAAKPGRGSLSHSVALDWVWKRVLRIANPKYVALLDHDVFPTNSFDVRDILANRVAAGAPRFGSGRWTLWPGLSFFRYPELRRYRITFLPSGDLDSGAGLWQSFLSKIPQDRVRLMERRLLEIDEGAHPAKREIEIIDKTWLHLGDGSGWFDGVSKVDELILKLDEGFAFPEAVREVLVRLQSARSPANSN